MEGRRECGGWCKVGDNTGGQTAWGESNVPPRRMGVLGVWMGEEAIAARLFASARESAGRGCETHIPIVGCRVVAGDRSSTRRACPGESRGL